MASPPDRILVKYSEDLPQHADIRPVVRQPMTLHELVGLVLATSGKHPQRVRALLRSGTCLYNIYRYWWEGFDIDDTALHGVLAEFPDPDPGRTFFGAQCEWARLFDAQEPKPRSLTIEKQEARHRRWFRRQSFWEFLMDFARIKRPVYHDYSYYHRADLYRTDLTELDRALILHGSQRLAPRGLDRRLALGSRWAWLELACRR